VGNREEGVTTSDHQPAPSVLGQLLSLVHRANQNIIGIKYLITNNCLQHGSALA